MRADRRGRWLGDGKCCSVGTVDSVLFFSFSYLRIAMLIIAFIGSFSDSTMHRSIFAYLNHSVRRTSSSSTRPTAAASSPRPTGTVGTFASTKRTTVAGSTQRMTLTTTTSSSSSFRATSRASSSPPRPSRAAGALAPRSPSPPTPSASRIRRSPPLRT